jgi:hypothetical protein
MTTAAILAVTIPTRENRECEKGWPKPPSMKSPSRLTLLAGAKVRPCFLCVRLVIFFGAREAGAGSAGRRFTGY